MLYEIYCEQFHQKRVKFNENLNVVLGTNLGHNSIGKSTFLLIIDFVFGGSTYSRADDIIKNIGSHDIYFKFKFNEELYSFCRNNTNSSEVWKCDENYNKIETINIKNFCSWLDKMYSIQLPDLTFRDAVGRYIRVYGKNNCDEKHPLHYLSAEKVEQTIFTLLKLFNNYYPIKDAQLQANSMSEKYKVFKQAQNLNLITKITKQEYNQNAKMITQIKQDLQNISNQLEAQIVGIDLSLSEEALHYKNLLSSEKRALGNLKTKYNVICNNQDYKFSLTNNTYTELSRFFPNVELNKIEKVESFHSKIAEIFKDELIEEKNKIKQLIEEQNNLININETKLRALLNNEDVPKKILQQHTNLLKELDNLEKQNYAYEKSVELQQDKKDSIDTLNNLKMKQLSIVQNEINTQMKKFNEYIYQGICNAPQLIFLNNSYNFFTPDDTGTGIACKGLVIFDLAILSLTKLPLLVHDSLILKQIYDNAIEKILELYINVNKQVIIAFDKQSSYTQKARIILEDKAILKLAPNGEELFGKSWG